MTKAVGSAMRRMLRGEAHVWSFINGDLASSTGISPDRGYKALMKFTGGAFADGDFATFRAGSSNVFRCLPTLNHDDYGPYTVVVTRRDAGVWKKYCFRTNGGDLYIDGVKAPLATPQFIAPYASFDINKNHGITVRGRNDAGVSADVEISEMVVMPYWVPDEWAAIWTTRATRWLPTPLIEVSGTDFPDGPLPVYCDWKMSDSVSITIEGVHHKDAVVPIFDIYEQPDL